MEYNSLNPILEVIGVTPTPGGLSTQAKGILTAIKGANEDSFQFNELVDGTRIYPFNTVYPGFYTQTMGRGSVGYGTYIAPDQLSYPDYVLRLSRAYDPSLDFLKVAIGLCPCTDSSFYNRMLYIMLPWEEYLDDDRTTVTIPGSAIYDAIVNRTSYTDCPYLRSFLAQDTGPVPTTGPFVRIIAGWAPQSLGVAAPSSPLLSSWWTGELQSPATELVNNQSVSVSPSWTTGNFVTGGNVLGNMYGLQGAVAPYTYASCSSDNVSHSGAPTVLGGSVRVSGSGMPFYSHFEQS